jgi:hypothetical protein
MQAHADILGEGNGFGVAENLDRFAGGVHNHPAVATPCEVLFEVDSDGGVEDPIEIAR